MVGYEPLTFISTHFPHDMSLRDIQTQLCGPRFETEVDQTVQLMLDWIEDLKRSDLIAMRC